ncbi:MAG: imidazole glycerol phosphate synthase subunit HisH [Pseudomonadota bacterium]
MTTRVVIVGSGGANIASLFAALSRIGVEATLSTDAATITNATHVILPGVGAAAAAMQTLKKLELSDVLLRLTQPVLGICLGMQLLALQSDEDDARCLGITEDRVQKIPGTTTRPVPHMGWNTVQHDGTHPLTRGITQESFFYFVHSYAISPGDSMIGQCHYGIDFAAIVAKDNYMGTQFHPERSATAGSLLLQNFIAIT